MNTKPFRMLLNLLVIVALALGLTPLTPTAARVALPAPPALQGVQTSAGLTKPAAPRATFTVNSALDTVDATPGDNICADAGGNCTLRAAIGETNALGGNNTITLQAGVIYTLTLAGASEDANATGDLDILTGTLTIAGNGATIDANGLDRALHIFTDTIVTLNDLTITGGRAPDGAHSATLNVPGGAGAPGGGIYNAGALTVLNSVIQANYAGAGGNGGPQALGGVGGSGGGIYSTGPLTVTDSTIQNNRAGAAGNSGTEEPDGSAGGDGGGIYSTGPLTVTGSTIQNNRAGAGGNGGNSQSGGANAGWSGSGGSGGGIWAGQVTLSDSTLYNNQAGNGGNAGLLLYGDCYQCHRGGAGGHGGGLSAGSATGSNVTITSNRAGNGGLGGNALIYGVHDFSAGNGGAGGNGGGIYVTSHLTLTQATLQNNQAGAGGNGGAPTVDDDPESGLPGTDGGSGGKGGHGGGFYALNANLNASIISGNAAGTGGNGQHGHDGSDGGFVWNGGDGGNGGSAGSGGNGGGGYISGVGVLVQCVVQNNAAGSTGNNANGGKGGNTSRWGGSGGRGGSSGGLVHIASHGGGLYGHTLHLVYTDILTNTAGSSLKTLHHGGNGGDVGAEIGTAGGGGNGLTTGVGGHGGGIYVTHGLTIDGGSIRFNRAGNGGPGDDAGCKGWGGQDPEPDGTAGGGGNGGSGGGVIVVAGASANLYGVTVSDNQVGNGGSPGGSYCSGGRAPNGQPGQGANLYPNQPINPPRDLLAITKTAVDLNGAPLRAGDQIRYTLVVTNVLGTGMTGLRITDTLPSGVTFVAATPGGYSGPNPLVWNVGNLGAGASWTGLITVTVDSGVSSIGGNYAQAQSDQDGPRQVGPIYPPGGGDVEPPLAVTKTAVDLNGAPLRAGDQIRYTLVVANNTLATATSLVLTDTLPASIQSPQVNSTIPITARVGTNYVWDVSDLAPGASGLVTITGQLAGNTPAGPLTNTAQIAGLIDGTPYQHSSSAILNVTASVQYTLTIAKVGTGDGVVTPTVGTHVYVSGTVVTLQATPNAGSTFAGWSGDADCEDGSVTMNANKACTATFTLSGAPPSLAIAKTAEEVNAPPLLVGDRILYTIRVTNTGALTLTNVVVTDTLPPGVEYAGYPKGAIPPTSRVDNLVIWRPAAALAPGGVLVYRFWGRVTGDPTPIADNCAAAISAATPAPVSACANVADPNVYQALELLKDAVDLNGPPLLVNDIIRYTIHVTNASSSVTMTHVVVTDTLPAGTVFVTATQPYTEAGGTLWWQVGTLAPGARWTVAVDQRVDGTANPIAGNNAAVWSDQQDWQGTGDIYPPDPVIQTKLELGKTAEEYQNTPPLLMNDRILYTIRVTNTTTGTLTGLRITDTLPAGVTFFDVPKAYRPYTRNGNQVVWERGSLAAGAVLTLQVIGKVDGTANPIGVNQARATCSEEATPAFAQAQVPGDGTHQPGLVITGAVSGGGGGLLQAQAALGVGDLLTYTVTVTNTNTTQTMHSVVITAVLPNGVELVSATPPGYSGVTALTWSLTTLGPGAVWNGRITVRQTGVLGNMDLAAASAEQSPVEITIAPPGGGGHRVYLPLVVRNQ